MLELGNENLVQSIAYIFRRLYIAALMLLNLRSMVKPTAPAGTIKHGMLCVSTGHVQPTFIFPGLSFCERTYKSCSRT